MKVKLTKTFIDNVQVSEKGRDIYTDETMKGFALYVGVTGKRYILNRRINGKLHRDLVEEVPLITLTAAREKAAIMMVNIRQGLDPYHGLHKNAVKAAEDDDAPKVPTLLEAYNYFLCTRQKCSKSQRSWTRRQITPIPQNNIQYNQLKNIIESYAEKNP